MPATDRTTALVDYIHNKIEAADLGFEDIWYGDQNMIPRTPSVAIEPSTKTREWSGTSRQTQNNFVIDVIIFHSRLEDTNLTRREALELAEDVEALLLTDITMGGLVYQSLVTSVEPGYANRGNILLQATQIRWEGRSKTRVV